MPPRRPRRRSPRPDPSCTRCSLGRQYPPALTANAEVASTGVRVPFGYRNGLDPQSNRLEPDRLVQHRLRHWIRDRIGNKGPSSEFTMRPPPSAISAAPNHRCVLARATWRAGAVSVSDATSIVISPREERDSTCASWDEWPPFGSSFGEVADRAEHLLLHHERTRIGQRRPNERGGRLRPVLTPAADQARLPT